jgi:elongation of very long chain fatty acids protein 4
MDAIVEYWGLYKRWAHQQETVILDFFDPAGAYKLHPMQDYPLADFSSVLLLIIAYLAFVCFGSLIMKAGVPAFNTSPLQFIYNPIQVILCSYMAVETLIQAYRHVSLPKSTIRYGI